MQQFINEAVKVFHTIEKSGLFHRKTKFVSCNYTAHCVLRAFADEFEDFSYASQTTVAMDID